MHLGKIEQQNWFHLKKRGTAKGSEKLKSKMSEKATLAPTHAGAAGDHLVGGKIERCLGWSPVKRE